MDVLIIGGGGREHALCLKIRESNRVDRIYCAPGNPGIAGIAETVDIGVDDLDGLVDFASKKNIGLTVVGPEEPLALGIVDLFEKKGLKIFGPSAKAAAIEASKSFAKDIMAKGNIPSPKSRVFTDINKAKRYIEEKGTRIVIKADGLAAGKGVIVCDTAKKALTAAEDMLVKGVFGSAGKKILVEEYLVGEEASFIAFCDGKTILPLPSSKDHKPVFDDDKGPNTGGMGAYSPAYFITNDMYKKIIEIIMIPAINAMREAGIVYKGFLYAGLMIDGDEVNVLEFNCRLGDPEAESLLVRVENDIVEIMEACIEERLDEVTLDIDKRYSVCVVMASSGYPDGIVEKGIPIKGLDNPVCGEDLFIFHAGTKREGRDVVTNGGRVLGITALGNSIKEAGDKAYEAVERISWDGAFYRKDIGRKPWGI